MIAMKVVNVVVVLLDIAPALTFSSNDRRTIRYLIPTSPSVKEKKEKVGGCRIVPSVKEKCRIVLSRVVSRDKKC